MFFHVNNLPVLVLVLLAWLIIIGRPNLRSNIQNNVFLALFSGMLVRSFANEPAAIFLLSIAFGLLLVPLAKKNCPNSTSSFVVVGALVAGLVVRQIFGLWTSFAIIVIITILVVMKKMPDFTRFLSPRDDGSDASTQ